MSFPFWSVGITNPLTIFKFIDRAEKANVCVYTPRVTKKLYIKKMDKHKTVIRPAFGGYMFVRIEHRNTIDDLGLTKIRFTMLKKSSGEYAYVKDSEIDRLKNTESLDVFVERGDDFRLEISPDGKIVIRQGMLAGKQARLIVQDDKMVWADVEGKKVKIPLYFFRELDND